MQLTLAHSHRWDVTPAQARAIQNELAALISPVKPAGFAPRRIAGVDVGFENNGTVTRAAVVVLDIESLLPVDCAIARRPTHFPYVPGLLSFREIPAVLDALAQLDSAPDALLCDGQGIAHPRRLDIVQQGRQAGDRGKDAMVGEDSELSRRATSAEQAQQAAQTSDIAHHQISQGRFEGRLFLEESLARCTVTVGGRRVRRATRGSGDAHFVASPEKRGCGA